ncbi:MAG: PhoH family protein, partial [Elusimicrobiota bacterium]
VIKPKSPRQKEYVDAILGGDMTFGIGPAGTGKTFLAVACALRSLKAREVSRIVLTRPVVEAGEKLGFLPGDLYEKVNPYLKPLFDGFYSMLGPDKFRMWRNDEIVEIVPLAYMRGRTLENAFIILDEAQNTTVEQMKMFLTRMGTGSRVVVTGDVTQVDLQTGRSGLVAVEEVLKGVSGIRFVRFHEEDVVRHPLVKLVIRAFEAWEKRK